MEVRGLPVDVEWVGTDPKEWRNLPDSDDGMENDEDVPTPDHVKDVLGFDPDKEGW